MSRATTTYVLLLTDDQGDTIGVAFDTRAKARAWEDRHDLQATGLVRVVHQHEALELVPR